MFLDILEVIKTKIKKIFRKNGFKNMVSDMWKKATKLLLENCAKTKNKKTKKRS